MGDARNALNSRDSHIWTLRIVLVLMIGIIYFLVIVIQQRQSDITVHVPPDLSKGATLKPGSLQKPNAYSFALYVWRGLNEWPYNGKEDYQKAIDKFQCLVTPQFKEWLLRNKEQKGKSGELERTRFLSEIGAYDSSFVTELGANVFSVAAVMQLHEHLNGMRIKNTSMSYSLRVIPDNRNCNEMRMALDGFVVDPTRAEQEAEENSKRARVN